jgi:hypothetical protein
MVKRSSERGIAARWNILLLCGLSLDLAACGSAGTNPAPSPSIAAPTILAQPSNRSVPMGLGATYSVSANGTSLEYQWLRDGAEIPGANASTFTTPPTTFADTGASFSVMVSNAGGSVKSSNASLTVTARAPAAGDLRFQQVDAPYVVNSWGNAGVGLSTDVPGRGAFYYSPGVGTSFFAGSGGDCDVPPETNGTGCNWFYSEWPSVSSAAPLTGYGADFYENFTADLQSGSTYWSANGIGPNSPDAVVTSLDLEPASDLFAVSWIQPPPTDATVQAQSAPPDGFIMVENTVPDSELQAAATEEGAAGRVITAISADEPGEITYLAYAWQADSVTLYDLKIVTATTPDAPTAAGMLAAQGYIVTAIGQADGTGDLLLVGTRVHGDTMPRPFEAVQGDSAIQIVQQRGYAIVGVIVDLTQADSTTYLAER